MNRWNAIENCHRCSEAELLCLHKAYVHDICFILRILTQDSKCSYQDLISRLNLGRLGGSLLIALQTGNCETFTVHLRQQGKLNVFMQSVCGVLKVDLKGVNVDLDVVIVSVHQVVGTLGGAMKLVGHLFGGFAHLVGNVIGGIGNAVGNVFGGVTNIAGGITGGVAGGLGGVFGNLAGGLGGAVGHITNTAGNVLGSAAGAAGGLGGGVANAVGGLGGAVGSVAHGAIGSATGMASGLAGGVLHSVGGGARPANKKG
ncbi:uncharacterized protein LOC142301275 isoform X1 [Anomaloglossus baeobatrachus]|uniref:uncharacterized protein LOC142301275 isoform X1 n=1 Tax=Anomaloglossus baeobatrachus TaxID=238106 RepID=UPI003F4FAE3F